ncbi:EutP/PduV family microcompartment system protein [Kyrpidia sp.]|uniref:EutP/PduV family microcompartment system protein n=1 Tax=Kyrpidia sp. TaxID=2073077 RepID=UPI0025880FFB|nr:EutP/PduV family microcompartment system protein [Kyrpidia sp.]MCL6575820.1 EutP/PduV family microcompartment system protein [Kyrpidia sp.]
MGKVMIIGAVGSGKSTLADALLGGGAQVMKTQAIQYRDWIVDTPGEYMENPLYYRALMATALEVTDVLLIQDATRDRTVFPPGFATGLPKRAIGVVTKADHPQADTDRAKALLRLAMPFGPIVVTSAVTGEGLKELLELL